MTDSSAYADKNKKAMEILRNKVKAEKETENFFDEQKVTVDTNFNNLDSIITNSNNFFLMKVLSPQITANEEKKRT